MMQLQGIIGVFFIIFLAYLLSNNKPKINYKVVFWGLGLQLFFAILILKVPYGKILFDYIDVFIKKILSFSAEGSKFLFGNLAAEEYFFN